jgi:hypothetical protein
MTRFVVGYPTTSLSCFLPVQVKLHSRPMTTMGQLWHNVGARTCHVVSKVLSVWKLITARHSHQSPRERISVLRSSPFSCSSRIRKCRTCH